MCADPSSTSRAPGTGGREVAHAVGGRWVVERAQDHQERRPQSAQACLRGRVERLWLALLQLRAQVAQDPSVDPGPDGGDSVGGLARTVGPPSTVMRGPGLRPSVVVVRAASRGASDGMVAMRCWDDQRT